MVSLLTYYKKHFKQKYQDLRSLVHENKYSVLKYLEKKKEYFISPKVEELKLTT